jgi:hypothetical protein
LLQGDAAVLETSLPPVNVDFSAAGVGAGSTASRYDHKHSVPVGLVGDVTTIDGTGATVGSVNRFLRADHRHAGPGPLVPGFNLNFSENEATSLCLENLSATYGTVTKRLGRIYFDQSGDRHPYIYTG